MAESGPVSPQPLSKRELKRQQRLAKEREKNAASPEEHATNGAASPVQETAKGPTDSRPSPFLEPVQKRIRNYLKKKQKIDKLTEQSQDPHEAVKLNADQKEILARKDQVLAPLKELQALAEQFSGIDIEHNLALRAEADERNADKIAAVKAAREEGYNEGKKLIESVVGFLGYASILRINPTEDQEYNEANERLLSIFYESGPASVEAAERLKEASDSCIEGTVISYARIAEAMKPVPEEDVLEVPEQAEIQAATEYGNNHSAAGHLVSFGHVAEHPSTMGGGGISFLNESEIEGSHAPEEAEALPTESTPEAPAQGVAETCNANSAGIAWNAETPEVNWADEVDASDAEPKASVTPAVAVPHTSEPPRAVLPTKEPEDEFTPVEGRKRDSGTRGRGRGDRRGRGRGRGRSTATPA
ncbi:hypothetical protein BCR37DRAFT_384644 [Protomyces lactucae-debilis]|uniref:YAG7-like dimerisation domain-containing protein n=1 Tax=Protomyces lactucae-debilis TaxID=2754530 RepID=A0A1Y2EQQ1_PROLT|nr:uncharacterized protein BCR37DRAFT_384644 [Protomyces lactucae-debilis]ORY73923.1 hypothetical protein BCR37DRAFT_384644 [Protomyces lactucae-debilis]